MPPYLRGKPMHTDWAPPSRGSRFFTSPLSSSHQEASMMEERQSGADSPPPPAGIVSTLTL